MAGRRSFVLVAGLAIAIAGCSGTAATSSPGSAATAAPSAALPTIASAAPTAAASAGPTAATSAAASAAPTAASSAGPTAEPTPAPTPEPTAAPTETPLPSIGAILDYANNLSHLNSYVAVFKYANDTGSAVEATHVVIRKPNRQESLVVKLSNGKPLRLIVIDKDIWYDQSTGTFEKNSIPLVAADATFATYDPGVYLKSISPYLVGVPVIGSDQKNGVSAVHLHAEEGTNLGPGRPTVPPGAVFDIWVSPDQDYLVALEYSGLKTTKGTISGSVEVTHVNDSSISVKAPS